jgi:hypothetical protein
MAAGHSAAHGAIAGAFFATGLVFGTWAARIPAIEDALGLDKADLAMAFVALNAGAVAGLHASARLVIRFGSRAALRVALPLFALLLPAIGAAPGLAALAVILALSAMTNSVVDIAINANGVALERRHGRPVLSRLHAMHTLGGITGAAVGALAAWQSDDVMTHFAAVAGVTVMAAIAGGRWLDDGDAAPVAAAPAGRQPGWILALGALAFGVTLAEGSANDWAAVYLHDIGAGDSLAACGLAAFLAAMTIGRLTGDHLRTRVGVARLFRGAAFTAAAGLGGALVVRHPFAGLAGFALFGLGLSVTLPLALAAASHRATLLGRPAAAAVAQVSAIAYLGSFAGPMLIGALATGAGLPVALFVPALVVAAAGLGCGPVSSDIKRAAVGRRAWR